MVMKFMFGDTTLHSNIFKLILKKRRIKMEELLTLHSNIFKLILDGYRFNYNDFSSLHSNIFKLILI